MLEWPCQLQRFQIIPFFLTPGAHGDVVSVCRNRNRRSSQIFLFLLLGRSVDLSIARQNDLVVIASHDLDCSEIDIDDQFAARLLRRVFH